LSAVVISGVATVLSQQWKKDSWVIKCTPGWCEYWQHYT